MYKYNELDGSMMTIVGVQRHGTSIALRNGNIWNDFVMRLSRFAMSSLRCNVKTHPRDIHDGGYRELQLR
jgi:hypothetical protein